MINVDIVEIHEKEKKEHHKNVETGVKTKVKLAVDLIILKLFCTTSNSSQPLKLFVVANFRCPFMGAKSFISVACRACNFQVYSIIEAEDKENHKKKN